MRKIIVVEVTETCITVDGHAGYAEEGKDIVCSAVSTLAQNLIYSVEALTRDVISYRVAKGHINIKYKNLSERGKLLVDSFFIGICKVQEAYGEKYLQIR